MKQRLTTSDDVASSFGSPVARAHLPAGDSSIRKPAEFLIASTVLIVAAVVYAPLFNRSNVLSHSIGYNLYASERVLEGAVPYRDFHTLYPPAIFYLNAALFKWFGVSLLTALLGVLVFKVLTVVMIYLSGRQIMSRGWAAASALSALLWLRPNGPFKSVPMHYGALFLALAMYFLIKNENRQKLTWCFLAGASLGAVALFKHNIGAYALIGSMVLLVFGPDLDLARDTSAEPSNFAETLRDRVGFSRRGLRQGVALAIGCLAVVAPTLLYMRVENALGAMIRTLLFGPGEFLLSRLAIPLSPAAPVALAGALAVGAYVSHKLAGRTGTVNVFSSLLFVGIVIFVLIASQEDVNQIIFYLPMMVLIGDFLLAVVAKRIAVFERRALLIVFIFGAAALMEVFPRFAREQSIAAMPFVMLCLGYSLWILRKQIAENAGSKLRYGLALAVLPVTFLLIEGRLFVSNTFDGGLRFKASTEVNTERGRGVYFPAATAALIDNAVTYIQNDVTTEGNAFAQSDAGTSLLFLANRRNVSNAQFWIGVGVTHDERAATLERIDKSQTKLIITSDEVLAAEKYEPMRDYIERNFRPAIRFDDVLMLAR